MIAELILGGIIVVLLAFLIIKETQAQKERAKFINALIAKSATELRDLELTEKVKPIQPEMPAEPNLVPEAELSDEEFFEKVIDKEIG